MNLNYILIEQIICVLSEQYLPMFVSSRELRDLLKESLDQGTKLMGLVETSKTPDTLLDPKRLTWIRYMEANISDISAKHWRKFECEVSALVSKYILLSENDQNQNNSNYNYNTNSNFQDSSNYSWDYSSYMQPGSYS